MAGVNEHTAMAAEGGQRTMRAAVLDAPHVPLRIEELAVSEPHSGEVLIEIVGCGVCHSDLHVMRGAIKHLMPCVLGHEVSGRVAAVGAGVDNVSPGDRVASAFIMPCGRCTSCLAGRDDRCQMFFTLNRQQGTLYDGTSRLHRLDGTSLNMFSMSGHAEYAVVPATNAFAVPDDFDLAASAIIGCAMFTAYGALRRGADLQRGESVAVMGVGGVGSSLVQLARAFGAGEIIAIDVQARKLRFARELGATSGIDASKGDTIDAVLEVTDGRGIDVVFDAVGRPSTFSEALQLLADGGRLVAVGLAAPGETAEVEIGRLVRRQLRLIGSYGARTRTDMPDLLRLLASSDARPEQIVTQRVGLDQINDVYGSLERGEILGRAVLAMGVP